MNAGRVAWFGDQEQGHENATTKPQQRKEDKRGDRTERKAKTEHWGQGRPRAQPKRPEGGCRATSYG